MIFKLKIVTHFYYHNIHNTRNLCLSLFASTTFKLNAILQRKLKIR